MYAVSTYSPTQAYNDLPPVPPGVPVETARTLKAAIGANRELAALRFASEKLPDPTLLLRIILLQESRLSSEIENIFTTNDRLYRALGHEEAEQDPHTKEVLHYNEALWYGTERVRGGEPISPRLLVELGRRVKSHDLDLRRHPGCRIANGATGEVVYSPPEGVELLESLLHNLCDFLNAEDGLDPLIKMAVAHYQFEAIHPFPDGNGRVGRLLNILYLVSTGLLEYPVLYLSRYFHQHRRDYYSGLRAVTEQGAWEDWIVYMLAAVESTAAETRGVLEEVSALMDESFALAARTLGSRYRKDVIETVFRSPYARIQDLVGAGIGQRQVCARYLRELESTGLIRGSKVGRDVVFVNQRLLDALTSVGASR